MTLIIMSCRSRIVVFFVGNTEKLAGKIAENEGLFECGQARKVRIIPTQVLSVRLHTRG